MLPLETIRFLYDALERGDVATVVELLDEALEWTEAEGFPYFGGTWRNPQAVLDGLLAPLARDWDGVSARPHSFVSEGDEVVAFGVYGGIHRASGRALAAPFAHLWRVVGGRIARFVQYSDTLLVERTMA